MTIRRKLLFVVGSYLVILTILFLMVFHSQSAGMLIVSLLVLLSLGGIIIQQTASSISAPIRRLREFTEQVSSGNFFGSIQITGPDEIVLLGTALNHMAVRLKDTVNSLELAVRNLHEKQEQLVEAEKLASLGRIAAGVSHEINNPLAIINEKAGLMQDLLAVSPDFEHKERLISQIVGIIKSIDRCRTITHRLLGFARRIEITIEPMDLNEVMRETLTFLKNDITSKSVRLVPKFSDHLPEIRSDKIQLEQVFLNLIKNAIDAVEEGGEITVATMTANDNAVMVVIEDNGLGIPKDNLRHIFEPFFTTKDRGRGTGLGLFVSHAILKKLGCTIRVESEVGKGTTFRVAIPVCPSFPRESGT